MRHTTAARMTDRSRLGRAGFTLIELLAVLVVSGVLASVAISRVRYTIEQARTARAIGDLRALSADIQGYLAAAQTLPPSLADVDRAGMLDPWGRPYVYVVFAFGGTPRTDAFGVDLNTDFDIYSNGPDGNSSLALSSAAALDDVLRGNDGGFLGRGSRY
ncbi:MAG: prepilin-type N-terminal cleavage/methylation domain-containing protein [Gemmatimonadetes bacterium]|nr:prepilin-type N-terminal cleavage/methylation domain-containing protein [Gemmatimonadota bacterium]